MPNIPTIVDSDLTRFDGLNEAQLAHLLRTYAGRLLMRGQLQTLLARREIGGLLTAFAKLHPRDRNRFEIFAKRCVDMEYSDARRHMRLWLHWPICVSTLERLQHEAEQKGRTFIVPGLRKLLTLAGLLGSRQTDILMLPPPPFLKQEIPDDPDKLRRMVVRLLRNERLLRAEVVRLRGEIMMAEAAEADARQEVVQVRKDVAEVRREIRHLPNSDLGSG